MGLNLSLDKTMHIAPYSSTACSNKLIRNLSPISSQKKSILGAAGRAIETTHENTFVALEAKYRDFRIKDSLTVKDVVSATWLHIKIAITSIELVFVLIGVLFILLTSGSFGKEGEIVAHSRLIFLAVILGLVFVIPIVLTFLIMPFHILAALPLYLNTGLILFVSSGLISFAAPALTFAITSTETPSAIMVFVPIGGVLAVTGFVLHLRNGERASYIKFNQRYPVSGLQNILPPDKQGEVYTLEAQDHYVVFFTAKGKHMHRMTMKSAIAVNPPDSGIRVHRSHWVAKSQIIDVVQEQQKHIAILRCGRRVPVGKGKVDEVRALL